MNKHLLFLVVLTVALLVGCNVKESSDSKTDDIERTISELTAANKKNRQLEEDYLNLENKLQKSNDRIKELEDKLQNDHYIERAKEEVSEIEDTEITEGTARKLVYEHIKVNNDPTDMASGYQYCVHKDDDVFIVEKFSPEPGTPDRSAVLLEQYQLKIETTEISKLAQFGPGHKQNCVNGTDI